MRACALVWAAVVLGSAIPAVAEEAPPAPAAPAAPSLPVRAKVASPFLLGLVGAWELPRPAGLEGTGPLATARWSTALDGRAMTEEAAAGDTATFSVLYVDSAGTGVTVWRFHSDNPGEAMVQKGTLSAEGLDLAAEGNLPELRLRRKGESLEVSRHVGETASTGAYVKRPDASVAVRDTRTNHPFLDSLSGDFAVVGTFTTAGKEFRQEGAASLSALARGAFSRTDYEATAGAEKKLGLGVASLAEDAASFRYWWFTDHFAEPTLVSGAATGTAWKGKGESSPVGPFDMSWTRTGDGFRIDANFGGGVLKEMYVRK